MFHYTVETNKSIEEVIPLLEASLKEEQFGVLWQLDIKETLKGKGLEFDQPYRVLEVCNPHEAKRILTKNKMVGYFLPCKIVIYEDEGKTKVGMPKPSFLIEIVDKELTDIAQDIEKRLVACIDKIV